MKVPKKGQGPTKEELKKQQRSDLMNRLTAVRAAAAAKVKIPSMTSPWKVKSMDEETQETRVCTTFIAVLITNYYFKIHFPSHKLMCF